VSSLLFGIRQRKGVLYVPRQYMAEQFDRRAWRYGREGRKPLARAYGMAARLFDKGRNNANTGAWNFTGSTIKALLLDTTAAGTWLKEITAASNAAPIVYTSAAHGFSNNDVLVVGLVGGNLSANQTGLAASVAANTFQMTTLEGIAVNGSGAYTSGGYAVDLTQATFVLDILGNRVGTDQTFAGKSSSRGIGNATALTWTAVPAGNAAQAVVFYDATGGSDATNKLFGWQDGKVRVVTNAAALAGATSINVQPLTGELWDGATGSAPVLNWSDGHSSTLNAAAAQGATSITITAQAAGGVANQSSADVAAFGGGLPVTPSGGNITLNPGTIYFPTLPTGFYVL